MDWLFFLAVETLVSVILILTTASVALTYLWRASGQLKSVGSKNLEMLFVTGRNVGSTWLISWAIYSQLGGAWMIPTFGYFGYMYGLSGVLAASIALSAQCTTVAVLSTLAYRNLPETCSLPRSIRARFGPLLEVYTLVVMLLANLVCLASEYTALIGIFAEVLGINPMTVLGAATVISVYYVCLGGALVGLFTDQINGLLGIAATLGVLACICTNAQGYRAPSRSVLLYGFDKQATQWFYLGTLYFNVTLSAFFEIMWQKHTCSRVKKDLLKSSCLAAVGLALTSMVWGAPGMVAAWKDMAAGTEFWGMSYVLHIDKAWSGVSIRHLWDPWHYWAAVLYLASVAIPSQAAIHAYSNAFLSSVYGSLTVHKHRLVASRGIALALNGAAIALASQQFNVLGLTIVANMAGATLGVPLFLSICSRYFYKRATGAIIIASSVAGLVGCFMYGVLHVRGTTAGRAMHRGELLQAGVILAFYGNTQQWQFVVVSLGIPLAAYLLLLLLQHLRINSRYHHSITLVGPQQTRPHTIE